jgi:anti-sigma factor RsiW
MATDPPENPLREVNWRRKATAVEEAQAQSWLAEHPEARADWESELALSDALARLPDAPVPSNFTARVVQTAKREMAAAERRPGAGGAVWRLWTRWLPGAAGVAFALALGIITYERACETRRVEMVRSVAAVSEAASLPNPQVLEDFDAIQAMSQKPTADADLLRLLQ